MNFKKIVFLFLLSFIFTNQAFATINLDVANKDVNKIGSVIKTSWTSSGIDLNKTLSLFLTSVKTGIGYNIKDNLPLNGAYDWTIPNSVASAKDYQLSLYTNDKGPSDASESSTPFEIIGSKDVPFIVDVSSKLKLSKEGNTGSIKLTYKNQGNMKGSTLKMNISCPEGITVTGKKNTDCDSWINLSAKKTGKHTISFENTATSDQDLGFTFDLTNSKGTDTQRVFEIVKIEGIDGSETNLKSFVQLINNTNIGTNGDAFLDLSIKGDKNNTKVSYWNFEYQCFNNVILDSGKSILCDGIETGKNVQRFSASDMYTVLKDYKMWTVGAQNKNSTSQKLVFNLNAFDNNGKLLGSDIETVILDGYKNTNAPVLSYAQAKAADTNEIFSEEKPILYGQNLTKQTQVYILVNGSKKYFDLSFLDSRSIAFVTPKRGVIPNGTYKMFAENGNATSNSISILYKNQTVNQPSLQVLYPNGGEILSTGGSLVVTFNPSGAYGKLMTIDLVDLKSGKEWVLGTAVAQATDKQAFTAKIPTTVNNSSSYKIRVSSCEIGICPIQDLSNSTFTISEPYIKILSPNGGEKYTAGDNIVINWETNLPKEQNIQFALMLANKGMGKDITTVKAGQKSYTWKSEYVDSIVSTEVDPPKTFYSDGTFKIWLYCPNTDAICVRQDGTESNYVDESDNSFVIQKKAASSPLVEITSIRAESVYEESESGVFTFDFKVTSFDKDIFIPNKVARFDQSAGVSFEVFNGNNVASSNLVTGFSIESSAESVMGDNSQIYDGRGYFKVRAGETETFSSRIYIGNVGQTGPYRVGLFALTSSFDPLSTSERTETWFSTNNQKTKSNDLFIEVNPIVSSSSIIKPSTLSNGNSIFSDLELGMTHPAVITLQKWLNSNGYIINTQAGQPGSQGYESDYFGEKTRQALIKFQQAKGIVPVKGYFGPVTRSLMGI